MRRIGIFILFLSLTAASSLAAQTPLSVQEGYTAAPAALADQVQFPMFACFDDRGRLFVAESSGLDLYAELVAQTRRCRIRLLEDPDEHGRFRRSRVFIDHLVFPMGLAWRAGKLYVADPPDLVSYDDHDGVATNRTVVLSGFGHTDNGSLHGLTFGPDGLLYMTSGNPDGYRLRRPDGSFLTGESGALIRCRPDGSNPQIISRGFENLVEVVFLPDGRVIGTDTWYFQPSGGVRDALLHLIEGGLYPLHLDDHGTFHVLTGSPMPPAAVFPAVAHSGLMRYEGPDEALRGQLLSAQHNARKVVRHVLTPAGSTFTAQTFDFATSDDPDFHPSDVVEDADGSILVVDTGGWYVQHCPTGRIRDSHAPGGIYRVRRKDAKKNEDPWGLTIDWDHLAPDRLVELFRDGRPPVRQKAQSTLVSRGDAAVDALATAVRGDGNPAARVQALWALVQISSGAALPALRDALGSQDATLAAAACRGLAVRGDAEAAKRLTDCLKSKEPSLRLAAAEALAHCGSRAVVPALVAALKESPDRFLEHSLVFAIHQWATMEDLQNALADVDPRVQKMALLLLAQPPHEKLTADQLFPRLTAADADLRQTAQGLLIKHPQWADQSSDYLSRRLRDTQLDETQQESIADALVAFQSNPRIVALVGQALSDPQVEASRKILLLSAMARMDRPHPIDPWKEGLAEALRNRSTQTQAARTIGVLNLAEFDTELQHLASSDAPVTARIEALRALAPRHPTLSDPSLNLILDQFRSKAAAPLRLAAAEVLAHLRLTPHQVVTALGAVRHDPLMTPDVLLPVLREAVDEESARSVIRYVMDAMQAGWQSDEQKLHELLDRLAKYDPAAIARLLASAKQNAERQRQKLAEYAPLLKGGDAQRGRAIFYGQTVACSTCHRIGSEGGRVGPDLTKIGAIRSGRDILESIVFPSSTFAQNYEPYTIATADGRVMNGILVEKTAESVTLRDTAGVDTRLRRDQIKQLRRDQTSIMPEGLDRALTRQQFRDLLAFLQSLK